MRLSTPKGCAHPTARFRTPEELEDVEKRLEHREKSLRALAEEIGCSQSTLSRIERKVSYRQK